MKSRDYILSKLNLITQRFPRLKILYQYDIQINTHIVEVHPSSIFESHQEYKDLESEISFEFDETFVSENLLFVSSNSLCKVVDPDLILTGPLFNVVPEIVEQIAAKFNFFNDGSYSAEDNFNFAKAA